MIKQEIPLERKILVTLIKKGIKITDSISEVGKLEGLTIQQLNVLRILRGRKGKVASLHDVSSQMIHSNSNTTRVIDKLITKLYVNRAHRLADRRQLELTITPDGLEVLKRLDDVIEKREKDLLANLTNQQIEQLLDLLSKI